MPKQPLCSCGECERCKHRKRVARWRATGKKASNGPSIVQLLKSLDAMRRYRKVQSREADIRSLGPRDPGSTLCPDRTFFLRESRSK